MNPPADPVPLKGSEHRNEKASISPVPGVLADGPSLPGSPASPPSGPAQPPTTRVVFGVPFHDVTEDEVLAWIASRARSGPPSLIVTSNLDFILQASRDPEMHRIHLEADLVIADGWPPVWFSRWFGPRLRARVAGSTLVPRLGSVARDYGLSLFALGGQTGVAEQAMKILGERSPGLRIAGWTSPPVAPLLAMDHEGLRQTIKSAGPDILLVAFGAPKQEKWIRMNAQSAGVPVSIGVGGSLDFVVGAQTRAPRWVQSISLEWLWRLACQPRRLFKRYAADLAFLIAMLVKLAWVRFIPGGGRPWASPPDPALAASVGARTVPFASMGGPGEAIQFLSAQEPQASAGLNVLDLGGRSWLNSLELGVIVQLAHACRSAGRPLFLAGVTRRVRRLIGVMKLDRYLETPDSPLAWERGLRGASAPLEERQARWSTEGDRLELVLPEELEGAGAWRAGEEFARRKSGGGIRKLVVDGRRIRYIDSSGLWVLKQMWTALHQSPGGAMALRSFSKPMLDVLRGQGLQEIPVEESPSP